MSAKLSIIIEVDDKEEIIYNSFFHELVSDLRGSEYSFEDARSVIVEYCQDYNPFNTLKK
jgi:hypothetical protein